jgi:hypothetical protein
MADFDFDEQDDISKGFEDEGGMSVAETERRQAEFQATVQKNMDIIVKPKQYDANKRREAIRWLGEAGDPDAIPALLKVYQKDKTPGFKEEAAYALGQFKALGEALDDDETEQETLDVLDAIVLHGKFGKRANALPLILAEGLLLIVAIALFAVGFVLSETVAGPRHATETAEWIIAEAAKPTATPDTEELVRAQLQEYYTKLFEDAQDYQFQLASAGRGQGQDCAEGMFHYPSVYNLSPMWSSNPSYVAVVDLLNEAHNMLDVVNQSYGDACFNERPIPSDEALTLGGTVLDAQRKLDEALVALNNAGIEVTEQALITNTPRPTEPVAATATEDLSFVSSDILALETLISNMTSNQGPAQALKFNWEQVVGTNAIYLSGCNQPAPILPADYALAINNQGRHPQLDSAVANVNTGLQLLRDASNSFYATCSSGEVSADSQARLDQVNLAISTFAMARNDLNALQGR